MGSSKEMEFSPNLLSVDFAVDDVCEKMSVPIVLAVCPLNDHSH